MESVKALTIQEIVLTQETVIQGTTAQETSLTSPIKSTGIYATRLRKKGRIATVIMNARSNYSAQPPLRDQGNARKHTISV
jgi:hypothetical protein